MTQGWQTHGRSVHDRKRKKARPRRVQQQPAAPSATTPDETAAPGALVRSTGATARPATSGRTATWRNTPTPRQAQGQTIRAEDYQYVYHDLKRIAVLAGAITVILIALTFVIR